MKVGKTACPPGLVCQPLLPHQQEPVALALPHFVNHRPGVSLSGGQGLQVAEEPGEVEAQMERPLPAQSALPRQ